MQQRFSGRGFAVVGLLAVLLATPAFAQDNSQPAAEPTAGVNSGDYNLQQSIEFGYRYAAMDGNQVNYDTFVNMRSGVRLFEHTLRVRSLDHNGLLFDNLSLSSFGYGGDANDLTRLSMYKDKWYDFTGMFRRDKDIWGYNLLANPLNPASSNPSLPINYALHGLDLVRRMSDFELTLMPQSRVRLQLGYSRNINEGPSLTTVDGGTEPQLLRQVKTTTNSYHFGWDFRVLPRTSFSYDQFLEYFKQDTSLLDQNFGFQLSDMSPVDLGIVFNTKGRTPCSSPVASSTTVPPTANPNCNGFQGYNRLGRPRTSFPTEQLSFQSTYFKNIDLVGRLSYSTSDNSVSDLSENVLGLVTRTAERAIFSSGPADARRVETTADWGASWHVTEKFRIVDSFRFDNFRLPGNFIFADLSLFIAAGGGTPSMLLPPVMFNPAACPTPTSPGCPEHTGSSPADQRSGSSILFFGQNEKTNTFELEYDFTSRFGGRIGYRYGNRHIVQKDTETINEVFFPTMANRGDCALNPDGTLPAGCVPGPNNSFLFSGADSSLEDTTINAHTALFGLWARPLDKLRASFDMELMSADRAFTRISPRQLLRCKVRATYLPLNWVNLDAAFDFIENRDNVATVNNLEHNRSYSFNAVLAPAERFSLDLGYSYNDIFAQSLISYFTNFVPVSSLSFYNSTTHFGYGDVVWKPIKRVTTTMGYAGTFGGGNTLLLNLLSPLGPLRYSYQKPYASVAIDLVKGLSYKAAWGYYGYNPRSVSNPAGLAPIGTQDFNGNVTTLALRYAF